MGVAALDWLVIPLGGAVPWTCDRLCSYTSTEEKREGGGDEW